MSFIAEIGLSKIRPEERLHTSGAIENIDGVDAMQARWVPVQKLQPWRRLKKRQSEATGNSISSAGSEPPP